MLRRITLARRSAITMPLSARTDKRLRIASVTILVLMAGYAAVGSAFSHYYKGLVLAKLPALAAKATDSLYDITVQDIRVNIFTGEVRVTGLRMSANLDVLQRRRAEGRPPHVVLDVTVPEAEIAGVKWRELKQERELTCRRVVFHKPQIRVQILPGWRDKPKRVPDASPTVSRVHAGRITIEDPSFDFRYAYGDEGFTVQSTGGLITASDWDYHPHKPFDTTRFFAARSADARLDNISYAYPGALYQFSLGSIHFRTDEPLLRLDGLRVKPAYSYAETYQKIGHRQNLYECNLPVVQLQGFAWKRLIAAEHALIAERLVLDTPQLSIYFSKRPPPNPAPHPSLYPSQWLHRLSLPLRIGLVSIWDGSVQYSETNAKTAATGSLLFNYMRGSAVNVTNMPAAVADHANCDVYMSGKLAHRADISAVARFPLGSHKGAFALAGRLRGLDAGGIREAVQAMAIADVKSLQVPRAAVNMAGNEDSIWGKATIMYNRLKVKLKKFDDVDSDVHSRVLLSFLANKILLYEANPMPGQSLRSGSIALARGTTRSFFQMVWKGIFQAGIETAIREEGAYDIAQRRKAARGRPKRKFFKGLFPRRK